LLAVARRKPIHPLTYQRYTGRLRRRFLKDYRIRLLGRLDGKTILDIGCGDVLLAVLGATVTGVDISPKSIELAKAFARANGVADRCHFLCAPIELADLLRDSFDVVWCDAFLHHAIADLPLVLNKLCACAKPGALIVFGEPVNCSPTLRRFRMMLPAPTEGTAGERPLEPFEIEIIRRYIPDLRMRPFSLFGRLARYILADMNYERASSPRRAIFDGLSIVDYFLLSLPGLSRFAGVFALIGLLLLLDYRFERVGPGKSLILVKIVETQRSRVRSWPMVRARPFALLAGRGSVVVRFHRANSKPWRTLIGHIEAAFERQPRTS